MTGTQLVSGDIERHVPSVVAGAAVVALVPATELKGWSAEMAWRVARAAAAGGRRTALVDCFVDAPTLHAVAGAGNEEGLVDAFEYGASLNRIVQAQPQANLFFIPAGTFNPQPHDVMANPRWRRLSAGFRYEEALLLLYVAAEHLDGLAAEPDGMIVLSPLGLDLQVATAPAVAAAVGRGLPLLAVVAEEEEEEGGGLVAGGGGQDGAAPKAPAAEAPRAPRRASRGSRPFAMLVEANRPAPWGRVAAAVVVLAAAAAGYLFRGDLASFAAGTVNALRLAERRARGAEAAAVPAAELPGPPPPQPVESLPWAIQVAALPRLEAALAVADSLETHGASSMVAPLRLARSDPLYLVYAGPYATATRADSALGALRDRRLLEPSAGSLDSVPLSLALLGGLGQEAARVERERLRAAGVPTFVLGQGDGTLRLFAGAYAGVTQTILLLDLLTPTGSVGELVPRVGTVP